MSESPATVEQAIKFALAQVGKPYRWGAVGPSSFDCSGLLWRAYQAGGIDITRSTGTQKMKGAEVTGDWLPGDLLFSHSPASPSGNHVKMYIGGGRVVEAPRTGLNVRVADAPPKAELNSVRRYVKSQQTAYQPTFQKAGFDFGDIPNPFGPGIDKLGDIAGGIDGLVGSAAGAAGDTVSAAGKVVDAAAFIIQPHNWFRMAMFFAGLSLMWLTFSIAAKSQMSGIIKAAGTAKSAATAAKGAATA